MKSSRSLFSAFIALSLIVASCDVTQTEEARLPDVDMSVDVEEGNLPEFDVDWAEVNVGTRTETVSIPKVVVVMEEEEIEIPVLDVDMPDAGPKEEITLSAEAEVSGTMHQMEIEQVYATGKRLYVISRLKDTGEDLGDNENVRVSDRLVLNAPDDLDIKHYVIGKRQKGQFNKQYSYISSMNQIKDKMQNGKLIYRR